MANVLKIKQQYLKTEYAFNNSGAPLGERDDLHLLLEMGIRSGSKGILEKFEKPYLTLEEITELKGKNPVTKIPVRSPLMPEPAEPQPPVVEEEAKTVVDAPTAEIPAAETPVEKDKSNKINPNKPPVQN